MKTFFSPWQCYRKKILPRKSILFLYKFLDSGQRNHVPGKDQTPCVLNPLLLSQPRRAGPIKVRRGHPLHTETNAAHVCRSPHTIPYYSTRHRRHEDHLPCLPKSSVRSGIDNHKYNKNHPGNGLLLTTAGLGIR